MPPGGIRREIYRVSANPYHVQAFSYAPKRMKHRTFSCREP